MKPNSIFIGVLAILEMSVIGAVGNFKAFLGAMLYAYAGDDRIWSLNSA